MAPSTKEPAVEELSEYEQIRARNIEKNNAQLRALGLMSADEEAISNAAAWGRIKETKNSQPKKRKLEVDDTTTERSSRKSLRLQGKQPDGIQLPEVPSEMSLAEKRRARVEECRRVRLERAVVIAEQGAEAAARQNPTATYEHCLMRVQSMTHKGLANRVKAIERAAGKHCVIKMAIFKSCLQDENLWDLAELASEALERLKALKLPEITD